MGFTQEEATQLMRIQVAMWLPASCWCGQPYVNVDDFIARNPKRGYVEGMEFVDTECWAAYKAQQPKEVKHGG